MTTPISDPVELPHTWHAHGARVAGTVLGLMLLFLVAVVWIAMGPEVRARFTLAQRSTIVGFGLLVLVGWYALVRSRVTAEGSGLTVVNGYRTRVFEWSQLVGVNLRRGAPWAGLDLSDGTSIAMFAIQGSDGERAIRAVGDLRRLVAAQSPTERDD